MIVPDRSLFAKRAAQGNLVPVYREILADRLTPVSAFERLVATEPAGSNGNAFLLESVEGGERIGRYSILGSNPSLVFRSKGRRAEITESGETQQMDFAEAEDPLTVVKALLGRYRYVPTPDLPRFSGGAVGYLAYDVVRFFERLPDNNHDELDVDDVCLLFTDTLLIFDHVRHRVKVVCNAHVTDDPDAAYDLALEKIEALSVRLRTPIPEAPPLPLAPRAVHVESLWSREEYEAGV